MKVRVRLFAVAKDLAGFDERTIELSAPSTARDVLEHLAGMDARFSHLATSMRLAVNQVYVPESHPLSDNDEVAVIPPVSGG